MTKYAKFPRGEKKSMNVDNFEIALKRQLRVFVKEWKEDIELRGPDIVDDMEMIEWWDTFVDTMTDSFIRVHTPEWHRLGEDNAD